MPCLIPQMKTRLALSALALSALTLAISCDTSTDSGTVPEAAFAIAYVVEGTGANVTVTQVDYTDTAGNTQSVMNPTLPWTITASRVSGETARLEVMGSTGATSMLTARIQDDPNVVMTPTTYTMSTCMENVNPCDHDIQNTF